VTRESLAIGSFTHLELDTDLLLIIALVLYMTLTEEDVLCWVCPVARTVQSKLRWDEQDRTRNGYNPQIELKILRSQLFLDLRRIPNLLTCCIVLGIRLSRKQERKEGFKEWNSRNSGFPPKTSSRDGCIVIT
jgi:hypothetical protein